jgi:lactate dehydrogenase-like 2-hydroxyacid dehydrogenase
MQIETIESLATSPINLLPQLSSLVKKSRTPELNTVWRTVTQIVSMLPRLSTLSARHMAMGMTARHMSKTVGIVTEKPFAAAAVQGIEDVFNKAGYQVKKFEGDFDHKEAVQGLDAAIVRSDKITADVMDAGKDSLKIVVRAGAGVDTIDLNAATERGMVIQNTPGQNANAVAELAFGMMLTNARNHYDGTSGYELKGKALALYGYGAVAQSMHKLAKVRMTQRICRCT